MAFFTRFYLDKEKDIIVELDLTGERMRYVLRTPNHATGNLITNLAHLCALPLSEDEQGLKVIRGEIPCYVDDRNRAVYILHLGETKVANIYPDGTVERKAAIPAIAKTLMSQTKDYRLDFRKTLVKTWILRDYKFRTDLHTHMNANLDPDLLIAMGIHHQIRYPLYYIKKLGLRCTPEQLETLEMRRRKAERDYFAGVRESNGTPLSGKYLARKIDDNTFINFADLMLNNPDNTAHNLARIRASLTVLKDGQAVFTNLEKVYLYRYVFTKGVSFEPKETFRAGDFRRIPDGEIVAALQQMERDRRNPATADFTLFQDKMLWVARMCRSRGITYTEISDTSLLKPDRAPALLAEMHRAMPAITQETGVHIRLLAAFRRTPMTLVRDQARTEEWAAQTRVLRAIAADPYVAGSDIVGEEMNDIRDLRPLLKELVRTAGEHPGFVIRIHAGENDSLRDNVANSLRCVRESLAEGQPMPALRIGHGLYTANLHSAKGRQLLQELRESGAVLEFQITSNVRLNNLSSLARHPLRDYLRAGIPCVQGTDGGGIYGTDSIDEQLALERLLDLTPEEMRAMRGAEERILQESLRVFAEKTERFGQRVPDGADLAGYYAERIAEAGREKAETDREGTKRIDAGTLSAQIREIPAEKMPIVLLGGSFNSDRHVTPTRPELCRLLREMVNRLDPAQVCFVIGHRVNAYERMLIEMAGGRFEIFAIVPTTLTPAEAGRLRRAGIGIRISIEPTGMGIYKSFAYEIFKRRPSVVLALDGNSAGANTIQEARNGKEKAAIFVSRHSRILAAKAATLEGYVTLFDGEEALEGILRAAARTTPLCVR